jgi:hypothetical protein
MVPMEGRHRPSRSVACTETTSPARVICSALGGDQRRHQAVLPCVNGIIQASIDTLAARFSGPTLDADHQRIGLLRALDGRRPGLVLVGFCRVPRSARPARAGTCPVSAASRQVRMSYATRLPSGRWLNPTGSRPALTSSSGEPRAGPTRAASRATALTGCRSARRRGTRSGTEDWAALERSGWQVDEDGVFTRSWHGGRALANSATAQRLLTCAATGTRIQRRGHQMVLSADA